MKHAISLPEALCSFAKILKMFVCLMTNYIIGHGDWMQPALNIQRSHRYFIDFFLVKY